MAEPKTVGVQLDQYATLKAEGSVVFQRLGPKTYQLVVKQFCPRTGAEQPPAIVQITRDGLVGIKANCQKEIETQQASIAGIDALIADIDASEPAQ